MWYKGCSGWDSSWAAWMRKWTVNAGRRCFFPFKAQLTTPTIQNHGRLSLLCLKKTFLYYKSLYTFREKIITANWTKMYTVLLQHWMLLSFCIYILKAMQLVKWVKIQFFHWVTFFLSGGGNYSFHNFDSDNDDKVMITMMKSND